MAIEQGVHSILAVDCGSVVTKAVLLDRVSGTYRFIAKGEALTTVEPPWQDIAIGVERAIEQIEDVTMRVMLDEGKHLIVPQQSSGVGVDAFLIVGSAAPPIHVVLAGLVPELSLSSAIRAVAGTYSAVEGIIIQEPRRRMSTEEQIQLILDSQSDVICITGGTDNGARIPPLELTETIALAYSLLNEGSRPRLLYAGNAALRQRVAEITAGLAEVHAVDNVRPSLDIENLSAVRTELDTMYREQHLARLPGIELITEWSDLPIFPAAEAFSRLVQYMWYLDESPKGTLGIDLGAVNTTVAAVFESRLYVTIRGDLGSVHGGRRILEQRGGEMITRWMPIPYTPEQAHGALLNRELRPGSVPEESEELWLEQAVAREIIREALKTARPGWHPGTAQPHRQMMPLFDPILVSGGVLAGAPRPGQVALMVLDAVEPIGVSTLLVDSNGLATVLGAVAHIKPQATVDTLDNGGIVNLATAICPVGMARKGDIVLRVRVNYEQGGTLEVEVPYGSLEVLPLPPGQEAILELQPLRRFDVGLGGPGKGGKRRVWGGLVGLIVDARGRPLQILADAEERQEQLQQWLWDMGG